jgi:hypothetical protein
LPCGYQYLLPTGESERLTGGRDYLIWSIRMQKAAEACEIWSHYTGTATRPTEIVELSTWTRKEAIAQALLLKAVKNELVFKIAEATTAADAWNALKAEFGQIGSREIHYWFMRLTHRCLPDEDTSTHASRFQEAIFHLAHTNFDIPSRFASAFLLATLPSNWQDLTGSEYVTTVFQTLENKHRLEQKLRGVEVEVENNQFIKR